MRFLTDRISAQGTSDSPAFQELVQAALRSGALTEEAVRNPSSLASPELEAEYGRGAWVLQPPYAWGYCSRTLKLKPPRAHYCGVSRALVLNMDHYCIWVFNTIGWANYRHFLLFLLYFFGGVVLAVSCTLPLYLERLPELDATIATLTANVTAAAPKPGADPGGAGDVVASIHAVGSWLWSVLGVLMQHSVLFGVLYHGEKNEDIQLRVHPDYPRDLIATVTSLRQLLEISCFVGCIVAGMLSWHTYLCLTAQTSVEYRGNQFRGGLINSEDGRMWAQWKNRPDLLEMGATSPYTRGWYANVARVRTNDVSQ